MNLDGIISIVLLSISIGISLVLIYRTWQERAKPGALGLLLTVFFTTLWAFGYLLEIALPSLGAKTFWGRFQYIGITLLPVSLFLFSLLYCGYGKLLTRWRVAGILVIPALTIVATYTTRLVFSQVELRAGPLMPLDISHGWWFYIHTAYSYILLLATTIIFAQLAFRSGSVLRYQARLMLGALLVPWISNFIYLLGLSPIPSLDLTPLAFTITNVLLVLNLMLYRLFDIMPVAHKAVFDAMKSAIVVLDDDDRLVDMNAAAHRLFNLAGEWIGQPLAQTLPVVHERLQAQKPKDENEISLRSGGQEGIFSLDTYPLFDWRERPSGRLLVLEDITDRKRIEVHRKKYEAGLIETSRMKTQLLASVSHDLRTPLSVIVGYTDMLREGIYGALSEPQEQVIEEIMESTYQLVALVDNLVGEAQLAAGRLTLHLQPFEPEVLIRGVRSAGSLLAQRKGLELELEVEPDMPEWLMGDVNWLKQIVVNLAINAIKFTDNGRVSVHLQKVDEGHWAIKVSDTGMGIPRELQEVIFEPFKQAEGLGAERRGGSGLGLSIVRNLVGLMQGKIELESEAGVGATFRVTLPLEPMERMT